MARKRKPVQLPPDVLAMFQATGRKGGKKRAKNLSKKQRSAAARKAARARWGRERRASP